MNITWNTNKRSSFDNFQLQYYSDDLRENFRIPKTLNSVITEQRLKGRRLAGEKESCLGILTLAGIASRIYQGTDNNSIISDNNIISGIASNIGEIVDLINNSTTTGTNILSPENPIQINFGFRTQARRNWDTYRTWLFPQATSLQPQLALERQQRNMLYVREFTITYNTAPRNFLVGSYQESLTFQLNEAGEIVKIFKTDRDGNRTRIQITEQLKKVLQSAQKNINSQTIDIVRTYISRSINSGLSQTLGRTVELTKKDSLEFLEKIGNKPENITYKCLQNNQEVFNERRDSQKGFIRRNNRFYDTTCYPGLWKEGEIYNDLKDCIKKCNKNSVDAPGSLILFCRTEGDPDRFQISKEIMQKMKPNRTGDYRYTNVPLPFQILNLISFQGTHAHLINAFDRILESILGIEPKTIREKLSPEVYELFGLNLNSAMRGWVRVKGKIEEKSIIGWSGINIKTNNDITTVTINFKLNRFSKQLINALGPNSNPNLKKQLQRMEKYLQTVDFNSVWTFKGNELINNEVIFPKGIIFLLPSSLNYFHIPNIENIPKLADLAQWDGGVLQLGPFSTQINQKGSQITFSSIKILNRGKIADQFKSYLSKAEQLSGETHKQNSIPISEEFRFLETLGGIKNDLPRGGFFSGIGEFKLNNESLNTSPRCVISTVLRLDTGKIDINKISEDSCCKTVTPSPGGNFTNGSGGGGNWGDKDEL